MKTETEEGAGDFLGRHVFCRQRVSDCCTARVTVDAVVAWMRGMLGDQQVIRLDFELGRSSRRYDVTEKLDVTNRSISAIPS